MLRRLDDLTSLRSGRTANVPPRRRRWRSVGVATAAIVLLIVSAVFERRATLAASWQNRWNDARIERDSPTFPVPEVDAAISNDGQQVAFLADRDSVFDAFSMRVGSGQFVNLTGGRLPQLSTRTSAILASPPTARTYECAWQTSHRRRMCSWCQPRAGPPSPFIKKAVMAVWSPDGSKIAYHETTPGDPIFVTDGTGKNPLRIFIADPGVPQSLPHVVTRRAVHLLLARTSAR